MSDEGVDVYLRVTPSEFNDFVLSELKALCTLNAIDPAIIPDEPPVSFKAFPVLRVRFPSKAAVLAVVPRCGLLAMALEAMGEGTTKEELYDSITAHKSTLAPYLTAGQSFCVDIESYQGTHSMAAAQAIRTPIIESHFSTDLPIRLKNPDNRFVVMELWADTRAKDASGSFVHPSAKVLHSFFGRKMCTGARAIVDDMRLTKRAFIGPTSLPPLLSLLMVNHGLVGPGKFMYDPFVGTGGLVLVGTKVGGVCMGADIDARVLRGKQGRTMATASAQYGLGIPEAVRMDNSIPNFRPVPLFHSIVCDPPYGIRAGARKSGVEKRAPKTVRDRSTYLIATSVYKPVDVMNDLLDVSARMLVKGGRLVFLMAAVKDLFDVADLPSHPCLRLVTCRDESLSLTMSRKMVVMEKVEDYDETQRDAYRAAQAASGSSESYSDLWDYLEEQSVAKGKEKPKPGVGDLWLGRLDRRFSVDPERPWMVERKPTLRKRQRDARRKMDPKLFHVGHAPFDVPRHAPPTPHHK